MKDGIKLKEIPIILLHVIYSIQLKEIFLSDNLW